MLRTETGTQFCCGRQCGDGGMSKRPTTILQIFSNNNYPLLLNHSSMREHQGQKQAGRDGPDAGCLVRAFSPCQATNQSWGVCKRSHKRRSQSPASVGVIKHMGVEVVTLLLDAGTDVNTVGFYGWTALIRPSQFCLVLGESRCRPAFELSRGADVHSRTQEGATKGCAHTRFRAGRRENGATFAASWGGCPCQRQPRTHGFGFRQSADAPRNRPAPQKSRSQGISDSGRSLC